MGVAVLEGGRPLEVCDAFASVTSDLYVETWHCSSGSDPHQDRVVAGVFDYQKRGVTRRRHRTSLVGPVRDAPKMPLHCPFVTLELVRLGFDQL